MRIFDCHSHWGTEKGYLFRTPEDLASQERIWKTKPEYLTEDQQADYFRKNEVRTILDMGWISRLPLDELKEYHDYMFAVQRAHPDVIFGHWINLDPTLGKDAIREFERCLGAGGGFVALSIFGQGWGRPPSDPIWDPYYKISIDAGTPIMIHTGLTGVGQGVRGGKGIINDHAHPRHVDEVAARFPDLNILAARPAYPWQDEMISVLLHKANVQYELHGWSPKYISDALKKEIRTRLQDRVMFGCDFPVLKYEKIAADWRSLGYSDEILEKVFHKNAEAYFPGAARADAGISKS
jgi:predicted TIM-barrel fold metal-dependent hydrolase